MNCLPCNPKPADPDGVRINRYIASSGVCSRRKADELIAAGEVTIDGVVAEMGAKVQPQQAVCVRGVLIRQDREFVYIVLNKPSGVTCTAAPKDPDNVIDYISFPSRIFPVGRLDKDSTGLLLLTNDGTTANKILRTDGFHEKEYDVCVDRNIDETFIRSMASGIPILNRITLPCLIRQTGKRTFTIVLTQGLNRQIRRMCAHLGYQVRSLKRTRIMNIHLGSLPIGKWRHLTPTEINGLTHLQSGLPPDAIEMSRESSEASLCEPNVDS